MNEMYLQKSSNQEMFALSLSSCSRYNANFKLGQSVFAIHDSPLYYEISEEDDHPPEHARTHPCPIFFFCVGVMYSGEYNVCDLTLSEYPHLASLKNMPGHGGNRTYDLVPSI